MARTLDEVKGGVRFLLSFAQLLIAELEDQEVPFEAIDRLTRNEGQQTMEKVVRLIKQDWLDEKKHAPVPPPVRPKRVLDQEEMRCRVFVDPANFSLEEHHLEVPLQLDESCYNVSDRIGKRDFLVKRFLTGMSRSAVKHWAKDQGYRVATVQEVDALVKAHPELLQGGRIVVLGSHHIVNGHGKAHPVLQQRGQRTFETVYQSQYDRHTRHVLVKL